MSVEHNDIVRVDDVMTYQATDQVVNVYHLRLDSAVTISDTAATSAIAEFLSLVHGQSDDIQGNHLGFNHFRAVNITKGSLVGEHYWTGSPHGTIDGDMIPPLAAGLITLYTEKLKCRGRKFIAGIAESMQGDGVLGSTALSTLADIGLLLVGQQEFGDYLWTAGVPDKLGVFRPFVTAAVRSIIAAQRRRKQGVGS